MCKFKIYRLSRFLTGACQVFTTQKPLPSKIPLTIKTATLNYFWTHFLIKVPSVKLLLKSMHPLHEINHSSACKKSKCMNSSWVFPFLNFIFLWEWNKQKIINKTRHEIHAHFFYKNIVYKNILSWNLQKM